MATYFTSCDKGDEAAVRILLTNDGHQIVETINEDIVIQVFEQNRFENIHGIPGADPKVVVHSRK
jgi:hypothetical protein